MKLLEKPFADYLRDARAGIGFLLVVALIRFLMKPVFQVPYDRGTNFTSLTILLPMVMVIYTVRVMRTGGTYRDLLGYAAALSLSTISFVIVAIAVDDFGGIDTYYTDLLHGGALNPWAHMGGHVIEAIALSLVLWGLGSLIYAAGRGRKKAVARA